LRHLYLAFKPQASAAKALTRVRVFRMQSSGGIREKFPRISSDAE
jgi:hypothetical protein